MENYICIDGEKTEISRETADNLKKQFSKPTIRHGDYRVSKGGSVQFFVKDDKDGTMRLCQDYNMFSGSMHNWCIRKIDASALSGNIIDDLKSKVEPGGL